MNFQTKMILPSKKLACGGESAIFNSLLEAKIGENSLNVFLTLFLVSFSCHHTSKGDLYFQFFFQSVRPFQPFELKIIANGLEHALEQRRTLIMQILPGFAIFNTYTLSGCFPSPVLL